MMTLIHYDAIITEAVDSVVGYIGMQYMRTGQLMRAMRLKLTVP